MTVAGLLLLGLITGGVITAVKVSRQGKEIKELKDKVEKKQ